MELLAVKFHELIRTTPPHDFFLSQNQPEDDLATVNAIMECLYTSANSVLGLHYLSSLRRDSLHTLARAILLDSKITPNSFMMHYDLFDQLFELLTALSTFSGDGKIAVIEVYVAFQAPFKKTPRRLAKYLLCPFSSYFRLCFIPCHSIGAEFTLCSRCDGLFGRSSE